MAVLRDQLTIGEISARSGLAPSALRFYEDEGLIFATRTTGNQRRFARSMLRRLAFIRAAQRVGLSLDEIRDALAALPDGRTPTKSDWTNVSQSWSSRLDRQIENLERIKDRLTRCVGCGCLSMRTCLLSNPDDEAGQTGAGPAWLSTDESPTMR